MSDMTPPAPIEITSREIARCIALDASGLPRFGIPEQGKVSLETVDKLSAELRRMGYSSKAYALEVLVKQHRLTPSRALIQPRAKGAPVAPDRADQHPAWQDRADLQ